MNSVTELQAFQMAAEYAEQQGIGTTRQLRIFLIHAIEKNTSIHSLLPELDKNGTEYRSHYNAVLTLAGKGARGKGKPRFLRFGDESMNGHSPIVLTPRGRKLADHIAKIIRLVDR